MIKLKTNNNWKQRLLGNLSKLSNSFLLVVAALPISGLLLGIGASTQKLMGENTFVGQIGHLFSEIGGVVFSNLGVLFCIALAVGYTGGSGAAGLVAFVGFLIFNVTISSFTKPIETDQYISGYNLLFWKNLPAGLFGESIGFKTLNTGVISGIIIGSITAFLFNRYSQIQLPTVINFFSGVRFMPILIVLPMIVMAFLFILIWPIFGKGLSAFGAYTAKLPGGIDSFLFHLIHRSLVPFGLHHAFYLPLWQTAAGGSIGDTLINYLHKIDPTTIERIKAGDYQAAMNWVNSHHYEVLGSELHINNLKTLQAVGDQSMSIALQERINKLAFLSFQSPLTRFDNLILVNKN